MMGQGDAMKRPIRAITRIVHGTAFDDTDYMSGEASKREAIITVSAYRDGNDAFYLSISEDKTDRMIIFPLWPMQDMLEVKGELAE